MKNFFIVGLLALSVFLVGCTDPNGTREALLNAGFTNIETQGYGWFNCSEDDVFKTNFVARNANGKYVKGTVCSGWFKGSTIRF